MFVSEQSKQVEYNTADQNYFHLRSIAIVCVCLQNALENLIELVCNETESEIETENAFSWSRLLLANSKKMHSSRSKILFQESTELTYQITCPSNALNNRELLAKSFKQVELLLLSLLFLLLLEGLLAKNYNFMEKFHWPSNDKNKNNKNNNNELIIIQPKWWPARSRNDQRACQLI